MAGHHSWDSFSKRVLRTVLIEASEATHTQWKTNRVSADWQVMRSAQRMALNPRGNLLASWTDSSLAHW
jgi:hypothetical protein